MFIVLVRFTLKPDSVEAFRERVLVHANNSLTNEETCRQFDVSFDPEEPTSCLLYEVYDDRAAFDRHTQATYFAEFGAAIEDWIDSKDLTLWERVEAD
ncbi:MAG: putative quinol monooxygenase [Planctomycetota bacterium]